MQLCAEPLCSLAGRFFLRWWSSATRYWWTPPLTPAGRMVPCTALARWPNSCWRFMSLQKGLCELMTEWIMPVLWGRCSSKVSLNVHNTSDTPYILANFEILFLIHYFLWCESSVFFLKLKRYVPCNFNMSLFTETDVQRANGDDAAKLRLPSAEFSHGLPTSQGEPNLSARTELMFGCSVSQWDWHQCILILSMYIYIY